jgi:hypothetical protein
MACCFARAFWLWIICGSVMSSRFAVRIASSASCLALWKPTKGQFLGSQASVTLRSGRVCISVSSRAMWFRETAWLLCGAGFSALLKAATVGIKRSIGVCCCSSCRARKSARVSKPELREWRVTSASVTVSPWTSSLCPNSLPWW